MYERSSSLPDTYSPPCSTAPYESQSISMSSKRKRPHAQGGSLTSQGLKLKRNNLVTRTNWQFEKRAALFFRSMISASGEQSHDMSANLYLWHRLVCIEAECCFANVCSLRRINGVSAWEKVNRFEWECNLKKTWKDLFLAKEWSERAIAQLLSKPSITHAKWALNKTFAEALAENILHSSEILHESLDAFGTIVSLDGGEERKRPKRV